jgi:hypothetical protein
VPSGCILPSTSPFLRIKEQKEKMREAKLKALAGDEEDDKESARAASSSDEASDLSDDEK